jgi:hypothetical protein
MQIHGSCSSFQLKSPEPKKLAKVEDFAYWQLLSQGSENFKL